MVGEGEAVALDSSTTAYYLALELRAKRELVVVTNGLLIAAALADAPGINVLVTGGMLRLQAMSLVGDVGADVLRETTITKGFLGARGLSLERGLMDLNPDEVRIKQEMARACERVIGIFDATKWHRTALLSFVAADAWTRSSRTRARRSRRSRPGARAAGGRDRRADPRASTARAPAPRLLATAAGRSLMATMAAVDLGAQSGPRRSRPLRRRAPRDRGGAPLRQRARAGGRDGCSGTCSGSTRTCWTACAPPPARRARWTRWASTRGPSTSGCSMRGAPAAEPRALPRRPPRRRGRGRARRGPARELYERTGIQLLPINTLFELAAMAAEHDPVLDAAASAPADPDLIGTAG